MKLIKAVKCNDKIYVELQSTKIVDTEKELKELAKQFGCHCIMESGETNKGNSKWIFYSN